jgi:protein-tyrosine phosphatase
MRPWLWPVTPPLPVSRGRWSPHILEGRYENTIASIGAAAERFRAELNERRIALEIGYAAEIRISPDVLTLADRGELPIVGTVDGYGIVLLEFPDSHILPGSAMLAAAMLERKLRPLIAHPERNKEVMHDVERIALFVQYGCWLQLTAGSVTGVFGPRCREVSRQLLERGWVSVLASDAHNMAVRVPPDRRRAAEKIVGERFGSWFATPAQIAANNPGFASGPCGPRRSKFMTVE